MTKNPKTLNKNDLQPENNSGGGGGQIFGGSQPLSDWVSETRVRAKLEIFLSTEPEDLYPEELLILNERTDRSIRLWGYMINQIHTLKITETKSEAFYLLEEFYFRFFQCKRFSDHNSFRVLFDRFLKKCNSKSIEN